MFVWKKQQVIILIVAALLAAGFIFFDFLPLRKRLKAVNQARTDQQLIMAKAANDQKQLSDLKKQLQELENTARNYQVNVPADRDLGSFLQQIADLMSQHNLTEQVVVPGEEIKADKLSCIPLNMQCKGKLGQVFQFYRQLQRLDRVVRIESVKLVNSDDLSGQVSMQTKAVVYYTPNVDHG
jgi:type IV pilus assembly protein PilO